MSEDIFLELSKVFGFDWDEGNKTKNFLKHNVTIEECEQVFLNEPQVILQDLKHSSVEDRYTILGKTDLNRKLAITFTIRENKIRVISARNQKKGAERRVYQSLEDSIL